MAKASYKQPTGEEFMHKLFEYEYCSECGGDECDHILCIGPLGWFAMCKVGLLTDDVYFRNGELHEVEA